MPRTDGAKVERGGEPHNRFPNISRKTPVFGKNGPFWGKSNRVEKIWTKLWEKAASMAKKNVRYFQEVGKKRAFFGKEYGKKEKYSTDTW